MNFEELATMAKPNWRDKYKEKPHTYKTRLENTPDDSTLNRMIILKGVDNTGIVEGADGKVYFDKTEKKVKIFIDKETGWKEIPTV